MALRCNAPLEAPIAYTVKNPVDGTVNTDNWLPEYVQYSKFYGSLRKRAYSNILRILTPKNENFQMKNSGSFHISA